MGYRVVAWYNKICTFFLDLFFFSIGNAISYLDMYVRKSSISFCFQESLFKVKLLTTEFYAVRYDVKARIWGLVLFAFANVSNWITLSLQALIYLSFCSNFWICNYLYLYSYYVLENIAEYTTHTSI